MYRLYNIKVFLVVIVGLYLTVLAPNGGNCAVLLYDDFDGPLAPRWTIQRGNAWTDGGWAYLHDPIPFNPYRDSVIITGEGADWNDYRFRTRFFAEGGGDGWYEALVFFRVQEMYEWGKGTYYGLTIYTPLWVNPQDAPKVALCKSIGDGPSIKLMEVKPPEGVVHDHDNTVEVEVVGGHISVAINGVNVLECTDPDPISSGGVGLGVTWEATTRFDYAEVVGITQCTLDLTLSYLEGTLNMDFQMGTQEPAKWNLFYVRQKEKHLLSTPPIIIDQPICFSISIPEFPNQGTIGFLTTFTTCNEGIICSDFGTVDTGQLEAETEVPTEKEIRRLLKQKLDETMLTFPNHVLDGRQ